MTAALFTDLSTFIELGVMLAGVFVAAVWARSSIRKQQHQELEDLAATRGAKIKDQGDIIEDLQQRVTVLEAKYEALLDVKAEQIADAVIDKLSASAN